MLPFLSLHALAAQRGDGLRPELLALFERHARAEAGLSAIIEPVETGSPDQVVDVVPQDPVTKPEADEASVNVSCCGDSGRTVGRKF